MPKLPNYERCIIPQAKITKYLLNLQSENGKSKARFFLAFGFSIETWQVMADALKQHAAGHEIHEIVVRQSFGINYVIDGALTTPDGRNPQVRVIWAIDEGDEIPRLVSAYPL
jgi:hypothetical protein